MSEKFSGTPGMLLESSLGRRLLTVPPGWPVSIVGKSRLERDMWGEEFSRFAGWGLACFGFRSRSASVSVRGVCLFVSGEVVLGIGGIGSIQCCQVRLPKPLQTDWRVI